MSHSRVASIAVASHFPRKPVQALRTTLANLALASDAQRRPPTVASSWSFFKAEGPTATLPPPLSYVALVGYFPTKDWTDDPTMPDFCSDHDYRLGWYCVADFKLTGGDGRITPLTMVVNFGDADCNTGFWGGIFCNKKDMAACHDTASTVDGTSDEHHVAVARVWSSGDTETTIEQENDAASLWFTPYREGLLQFPNCRKNDDAHADNDDDDNDREPYFSGLSPGFCATQLEKLLGVAVDTAMMSNAWESLPVQLRFTGRA